MKKVLLVIGSGVGILASAFLFCRKLNHERA